MKRRIMKFNTISSRFALIVTITVLGCMLLLQTASFFTMRGVVEDHGKATMRVANESLTQLLEDEYFLLVQSAQTMSNSGMVGKLFSDYLQADGISSKWNTQQALEDMLITVNFSSASKMAVYYNTRTGENYLDGYQFLKHDFDVEGMTVLRQTNEIIYHPVHITNVRHSGVPVVSLIRSTNFASDGSVVIYVEKQTNLYNLLEEYQKKNGRTFLFLQVSEDGTVCFSTDERIPVGTSLPMVLDADDSFGQYGDYYWNCQKNAFRMYNILLTPTSEFYSGIYAQMKVLLVAILSSACLILLSVVLLNQLIIKKTHILKKEIQRVGEGNLSKVDQYTGIEDYDMLLQQFDWMIGRLHMQMHTIEEAERHNGEIEREILYYQINPHFLLNSLNSAYWQVKMNIEGGIDQYIAQLTAILRYSLAKDPQAPTLRKEVEILQLYLQLQKKRYDFTYTLDVEEGDYLQLQVPRLFIQPVVENSIEHGMDVGGHITIRIYREGNEACVFVGDNGVGMSEETLENIRNNMEKHSSRAGIGLRYANTVVTAMFGDAAELKIESEEGLGTQVYIRLPLSQQPEQQLTERGASDD